MPKCWKWEKKAIRDLFCCVITALQPYIAVLKCVISGNRGGLRRFVGWTP